MAKLPSPPILRHPPGNGNDSRSRRRLRPTHALLCILGIAVTISFTIWIVLIIVDVQYDVREGGMEGFGEEDDTDDAFDVDGGIGGVHEGEEGCTLGAKTLALGVLLPRESVSVGKGGTPTNIPNTSSSSIPIPPPCLMMYRISGIRYNYGAYEVRISTLGSVRASMAVKLVWLPTAATLRRRSHHQQHVVPHDDEASTNPPSHQPSTPSSLSSRRRLTDIHKVIFRADTMAPDGGDERPISQSDRRRVVWPTEGHDGPLVQFRTSTDMKNHYYNFAPLPPPSKHSLSHLGEFPVEVVDRSAVDLYALVWCTNDDRGTINTMKTSSSSSSSSQLVHYTITLDRMYLGQFPSSALHSLAMLVVPVAALTLGVVPWLIRCIRL